jgi:hypothetical protein
MEPVSEIKLIRTDTTLDLSQKAEKVWVVQWSISSFLVTQTAHGFLRTGSHVHTHHMDSHS